MLKLLEPEYWAARRWEYLDAARACREVLIRQDGHWRYAPNDPRVKKALGAWIYRARNAHAFALGRKPVIANAVVVNGGEAWRGALYAGPKQKDIPMINGKYIVETETGNDWENCWREDAGEANPDGTPVTFNTLAEAVEAIKEHIDSCKQAVTDGFMNDCPEPSEFRVRRGQDVYEHSEGLNWIKLNN